MSRLKLAWFELNQNEGEDLFLKIPLCEVYSGIIDRAFPKMDHIGWREGSKTTCYTYIKYVSEEDEAALEKFLTLLSSILCLTRTQHLDDYFTDELDEAYALDFNFDQDKEELTYTTVGAWEHEAKEQQDSEAIDALANRLADVIESHPTLARAHYVLAVPPRPSKSFHLPNALVGVIEDIFGPAAALRLAKRETPKLKDLPLAEKVAVLSDAFTLRTSVDGKSIVLIDDLYQSGVTLWSLARFLKEQGARRVYGLACVKSWRDTDNQ